MNDILTTSPMFACGPVLTGPLVAVLLGMLALWFVSACLALANFTLIATRPCSTASRIGHLGLLFGCATAAYGTFNGSLEGTGLIVALGVPVLVIGQFCRLIHKNRMA